MTNTRTSLRDCFGIDPNIRTIAIVGAGGKTSLMYALAQEIASAREPVITTTTTKILPPTPHQSPCLMLVEDDPVLERLPETLSRYAHVTVGRSIEPLTGKLLGVTEETAERCLSVAGRLIVEADGAAGRPVKAPERWEPVIPRFTDLVIPVVGLDCLGKPASEEWVFRLDRFLEVTGLDRGDPIDPRAIAALLQHPLGGLKGVPEAAVVVPFLNKTDQLRQSSTVEQVLDLLGREAVRIKKVVTGCLRGKLSARTHWVAAYTESPS
ncbi:MAG: putative selenium-dependent hydroxylase accessory protein YqeC [Desulfomonile tiedjei]|nr:putative selenium-dependent hydroxylase accessory protein YqeC [Desulfomonile tiedjei]